MLGGAGIATATAGGVITALTSPTGVGAGAGAGIAAAGGILTGFGALGGGITAGVQLFSGCHD